MQHSAIIIADAHVSQTDGVINTHLFPAHPNSLVIFALHEWYIAVSDDGSSIEHTDNREEVDQVMNPVRLLTAGLLTMALPGAAHPQDSRPRVAAAITYQETGRPQDLPEAFQPGPSATFLTITSIDGHQNNALLWRSSKGGDTLLVSTGGSGGAYHADPLSNLGRALWVSET